MQRQAISFVDTDLTDRSVGSFKHRFLVGYLPFMLIVAGLLTVVLMLISYHSLIQQQKVLLTQKFSPHADRLQMLILGGKEAELPLQLQTIADQLGINKIEVHDQRNVCVASFSSGEVPLQVIDLVFPLSFKNGGAIDRQWHVSLQAPGISAFGDLLDSFMIYQLIILILITIASITAFFVAFDAMIGEPAQAVVLAMRNRLDGVDSSPVECPVNNELTPVVGFFNRLLAREDLKARQVDELLINSGTVWFSFSPDSETFTYNGSTAGISWLNASLIRTPGDLVGLANSSQRASFRQKWHEIKARLASEDNGSDVIEVKIHAALIGGETGDTSEKCLQVNLFWSGDNDKRQISGYFKDISLTRRHEEELQNFADNFRHLYENSPLGIWRCICQQDRYDYLNPAMAKLLGYASPEEAISSIGSISRDVFFNPGERSFFLDEVKKRDQVVNLELRFRRADGSVFWGAIFGRLYTFQGVQYCEGGLIDITERKLVDERLRCNEEFLRQGMESSGIVFGQFETVTDRLQFKGAVADLFGPVMSEVSILKNFQRLVHPEDLARINSWLERLRRCESLTAGDRAPVEFRICRVDNNQKVAIRWLSFTAIRLEAVADGRNRLIQSVFVDVTRQKEAEEKLSAAVETAVAESRLKSEFFAGISHEVRTPLNAIIGFSELLAPLTDDPRARHYVASILSSSRSLINILNSMLDLSRLEAGKVELIVEPVCISDLINDIKHSYSSDITGSGLEFKTSIGESVPASMLLDEFRIRQIITNLLSNSIRFTSSGFISLSVSAAVRNAGQTADLTISVQDTGQGIHSDDLKELFKPLAEKKLQRPPHSGGTGLGLIICHHLVELMGGKIKVKSEIQCGSRFDVILKDVRVAQPEASAVTSGKVGRQNYRFDGQKILVADDTASNRELMAEAMRGAGLQVICASDGEEAVRFAVQEKPELIFMDIRMPVKDGIAATRELKSLPGMAKIPVIAVTASTSAREQKELVELFDNFIYKPVSLVRLFAEAARYLKHGTGKEEVIAPVQHLVMPPEAFEQLHEPWKLVDSISNTWLPRLKELEGAVSIEDAARLADSLKTLSVRHSFNHLTIEAENLNSCLQKYDMTGIDNSRRRIGQIFNQVLTVYARQELA